MDKLARIMEQISYLGPDISFEIHSQGLAGIYWQARIEVNYTDMFDEKDFDKIKSLAPIEQRYVMEEIATHPNRAIENITRRLKKVYKNMEKGEE